MFSTPGATSGTPRRQPIVGIGMKMFHDAEQTEAYLDLLVTNAPRLLSAAQLFVLPSFPMLSHAVARLQGTGIAVGAQDAHWVDRGAFTGAVSPRMLRQLGCTLVEVGHAERRRYFAESDHHVADKVAALRSNDLLPLVCVGEDTQRSPRSAAADVRDQLAACTSTIDADAGAPDHQQPQLIVAYEPVWAINATVPASVDHVDVVAAAIRGHLTERGITHRVIYGGSVDASAAAALMAHAPIDGLFVGRAATEAAGLEAIVTAVGSLPPEDET